MAAHTDMDMKFQEGRVRRTIVPETIPLPLASAFNVGLLSKPERNWRKGRAWTTLIDRYVYNRLVRK